MLMAVGPTLTLTLPPTSCLWQLGEAALMRWTGIGLAIISAVCLAFIGEGCAGWGSGWMACCYGREGYSQVAMHEEPISAVDEEEAPDSPTKVRHK